MRIVGLGLDATEVPRIAEMLARYGDRFRHRVYTEGEIAYCEARHRGAAASYAARFAAKEAGMKAIGTGHARGVIWRELEVVRHGGPPQLQFHGARPGIWLDSAPAGRCSRSRTPPTSPSRT